MARHQQQNPTVGVVIPSYNAEDTLRRAVQSVLAQSYSNWRLVIVDDASSQPQESAIADLVDGERIRTIRLDSNGGAGNARNIGIQSLDTEWIAFLDSDDEWTPDKLREQLSYIHRTKAPISICASAFLYEQENEAGSTKVTYRFPPPADGYERLIYGCDFSPGSTLIVRRELYERHGYFAPELRRFEDWDWLLRCCLAGETIAVANNAVAIVHNRSWPNRGTVSSSASALLQKNFKPILQRSVLNAARFLSSTFLERAVAAWRGGTKGAAFFFGIISFAVWPFRDRYFFGRILHVILRSIAGTRKPVGDGLPDSVMHVISGLEVGGAENMLVQLVEELQRRGVPQYVVNLKSGGRHEPRIKELLGDRYTACGIENSRGLLSGFMTLRRAVVRARPKHLQGWMYHGDLFATLAYITLTGPKRTNLYWGIRCSNLDFSRYRLQLKATVLICKLLSFLPKRIVSNSIAGLLSHTEFGYYNRRLALVQNCVNITTYHQRDGIRQKLRAELGIADNAFVFVIVARTDPMKGYNVFLDVATKLPDMTALAAGLGTNKLAGPENYIGLGLRSDIPDLLCAVDAIVSTSHFGEGQSNSILEGMASGLPVVATDTGDSARIVANGGYIVAPRDVDGIVSALRHLRDHPEERAAFGEANRLRVARDFSFVEMANQFLAIYTDEDTREA